MVLPSVSTLSVTALAEWRVTAGATLLLGEEAPIPGLEEICILYFLLVSFKSTVNDHSKTPEQQRTRAKNREQASPNFLAGFIINTLDARTVVVKVTDDTILSLCTTESSILPLPPIHQAAVELHGAGRKGRATPPRFILNSYLFTGESSQIKDGRLMNWYSSCEVNYHNK